MARNVVQFQKGLSEPAFEPVRYRGAVPGGGDRVTMAEWLRMSGMWWTAHCEVKSRDLF